MPHRPARRLLALLCGALLACVSASAARAVELDFGLRLLARYNMQRNALETSLPYSLTERRFLDERFLSPVNDTQFGTFLVGANLDVSLGRGFSLTFSADSGLLRAGHEPVVQLATFFVGGRLARSPVTTTQTELAFRSNGAPLSDEALRTLFLREAYATYSRDRFLRVAVGKRRITLAEGFIYDQFALGASLRLDGQRGAVRVSPWALDVDAIVSDGSFDSGGKQSPLVHVGLRYVFGPLQSIGLSLIYFHDGDGLFSEVLRAAVLENNIGRTDARTQFALQVPIGSSADILWFGVSGRRFFGDHRVSGLVYGQAGRMDLSVAAPQFVGGPVSNTASTTVVGALVDLDYQYDVTEDLVVGAFFTAATGDDELVSSLRTPATRRPSFGAFLSLFPFVNRTNLFFNGGLNAETTQRRASTLGVNARGLVSGGAYARWDHAKVRVDARVAVLGAQQPSLYGGRFYGTEVDVSARLPLGAHFAFALEADTLFTGSFFQAQRPFFQLITGVELAWP